MRKSLPKVLVLVCLACLTADVRSEVPGESALSDVDGDGVPDTTDNCPQDYNPGQVDLDGDGEGDLCDMDDGRVLLTFPDQYNLRWQDETGGFSWNAYHGL